MSKTIVIIQNIFLLLFFFILSVEGVFGESDFTKDQFAEELRARITDVPEFNFIRNYVLQMPLKDQGYRPKIYLFGGAATGFASTIYHELKQDSISSSEGKGKELDISNIYDLIQDVDLVIDGTAEEAKQLQESLDKEFPLVQGESTKSLWEVRPLRCALGSKEALLNNPDISNQHTDSFSCGLIEITKNEADTPSEIRDLLYWDEAKAPYLKDVWRMRNHYRYNPNHSQTSRGQNGGINPPIISALRYLIKVSQYGAYPIPKESKNLLRRVIGEMKKKDLDPDYVKEWLVHNIIKLFTNAEDINRTWRMLDDFDLRKTLREIPCLKEKDYAGLPIADWFNKVPLPDKDINLSRRRKDVSLEAYLRKKGFAQETYIENDELKKGFVLAHEVKNYYAFTSMTKNHQGKLNAFISRKDVKGELAAAGDGFYVAIGKKGAASGGATGLTIHLLADPNAIEGIDFTKGASDNHLVIKNRRMLKVIREDYSLSAADYLLMIKNGEDIKLNPDYDKAVQKKLEQTLVRHLKKPNEQDLKKIIPLIASAIKEGKSNINLGVLPGISLIRYAFSLNELAPEELVFLKDFFKSFSFNYENLELFFENPNWKDNKDYMQKSLDYFREVCAEENSDVVRSKVLGIFIDTCKQKKVSERMRAWLKEAIKIVNQKELAATSQEILLRVLIESENNVAQREDIVDVISSFSSLALDEKFIWDLYRHVRNGYEGASSLFNRLVNKENWAFLNREALKRNLEASLKDLRLAKGLSAENKKIILAEDNYLSSIPHTLISSQNEETNPLRKLFKQWTWSDQNVLVLIPEGASFQEDKAPRGDVPLLELAILKLPKEKIFEIIRESRSWDRPWSSKASLYKFMKHLYDFSKDKSNKGLYLELRDIILEMIEKGKSIDYQEMKNHQKLASPLELAVKTGDILIVQKILEKGSILFDAVSSDGEPILFKVMKSKKLDLFKLLLEKGADYKTPNKKGQSLLEVSQNSRHHKPYKKFYELLMEIK